MKLRYEHGLLFTDISIEYNGKIVIVNDVVLDTGAALDFGIIDEEGIINGLLGLDVLMKLGIKINLDKLELEYCNSIE